MRIFKRIFLFLAVNLLVIALMEFVLTDPSVIEIYLEDIEENGYDTLIIGTSHGETGFDPFMISQELSCNAFNASRRLMPVIDQYYLLKTANSAGTIRTVYFELDPTYFISTQPIKTHDDTCMLRHARLGDRVEYAMRHLADENYNYALFPYTFDMKTLKKAPAVVKSKLLLRDLPPDERIRGIYSFLNISKNFGYMGRGFRYGHEKDPQADLAFEPMPFSPKAVDPSYIEAFEDIVRYCRREDIRLVCVISALPEKRLREENHAGAHAYFRDLCRTHGVDFYDMNLLLPHHLPRTADDYTDLDGHMMGPLARRQTAVLIKLERAHSHEAFFAQSLDEALISFDQQTL